ncbi:MAG: hypothetical protein VYD15_04960 [Actinomycetota bacterium]|nr:hypothetical protein [Actinomycetota bacterium]MEE3354613.1 hypothetical protein [Actinomycetota bacterium]
MTPSTDPALESAHAENLASSLRRVERQKRSLEEWVSTLERTVTAHERVARDREADRAELAAQSRVLSQELAAVEKRLTRTLESQSFRLGHLLVRIAVSPVKLPRRLGRVVRLMLVWVYRLAQRTLPRSLVEPLQQVATRGQTVTARRHEALDLPGDRPVSFVDCRGLSATARDEVWARAAASDQPARTVVLTDDVDFTGLRALGLSFEYLPPYREGTPWWSDEADHARWADERLAAMRLGYAVDDLG